MFHKRLNPRHAFQIPDMLYYKSPHFMDGDRFLSLFFQGVTRELFGALSIEAQRDAAGSKMFGASPIKLATHKVRGWRKPKILYQRVGNT